MLLPLLVTLLLGSADLLLLVLVLVADIGAYFCFFFLTAVAAVFTDYFLPQFGSFTASVVSPPDDVELSVMLIIILS